MKLGGQCRSSTDTGGLISRHHWGRGHPKDVLFVDIMSALQATDVGPVEVVALVEVSMALGARFQPEHLGISPPFLTSGRGLVQENGWPPDKLCIYTYRAKKFS